MSHPNPVDVLANRVANRQEQLEELLPAFEGAFILVTDPVEVHAAISTSPRPDLALNDPAQMMQVPDVAGLRRTNNFTPNMRSFGSRKYLELEEPNFRGETREWVGYEPATDEELEVYFSMGALGSFADYKRFAEDHPFGNDRIMDMFMQTHIDKPAFMRMWIVCPDLTVQLMRHCVDTQERHLQIGEELFVAYSLMAQLVDKNDAHVKRPELIGQVDEKGIDPWYLCR